LGLRDVVLQVARIWLDSLGFGAYRCRTGRKPVDHWIGVGGGHSFVSVECAYGCPIGDRRKHRMCERRTPSVSVVLVRLASVLAVVCVASFVPGRATAQTEQPGVVPNQKHQTGALLGLGKNYPSRSAPRRASPSRLVTPRRARTVAAGITSIFGSTIWSPRSSPFR